MIRIAAVVASLVFALATVGCAGGSDDVGIARASLEDQHLELVEMHGDDGLIEVEVYYSVAQSEEAVMETYRWQQGSPSPVALLELLAGVDPALLDRVHTLDGELGAPGELSAPSVTLDLAWPRLLQEARLLRTIERSPTETCRETDGFTDCLGQR